MVLHLVILFVELCYHQVKIKGVLHEFSSLPGVKEDVTEIVMNIKDLCIKNNSTTNEPKVAYIDASGDKVVTAILLWHCAASTTTDGPISDRQLKTAQRRSSARKEATRWKPVSSRIPEHIWSII